MKILAAVDSFKGSMSSQEANQAVGDALPQHEVVTFPIADGGEGTVSAFVELEKGERITEPMTSVNGKLATGTWGWIEQSKTAIIEAAEGAGIIHADPQTFHPTNHTSYGMGEQILQALDKGAETLIIGLGGTATVDGGLGMLQALGVHFYDKKNQLLPRLPIDLGKTASIDRSHLDERLSHVQLIIASDVANPLCGTNGATYIFGEQKGLHPDELHVYDKKMGQYQTVVEQVTNKSVADDPGAGAAGGLGFAFLSFFSCHFESGLTLLAERGNLREILKTADLVITGEGKFDAQSLEGKVPIGLSRIAEEYNIPTLIFAGKIADSLPDLKPYNIVATVPIVDRPMTLEEAMATGPLLLKKAVERSFRLIDHYRKSQ
ncbi:glycerate kinase [Lacticigenium naphthae]|uniref:glycerate kinase family protein n=1 Tax=Lacticigenium naphthae TaxID=515351 RepID=UPI00040E78B7|nr:glycerate kinase [Lacticigenium naphthae]